MHVEMHWDSYKNLPVGCSCCFDRRFQVLRGIGAAEYGWSEESVFVMRRFDLVWLFTSQVAFTSALRHVEEEKKDPNNHVHLLHLISVCICGTELRVTV